VIARVGRKMILERRTVKFTYNKETDTLLIVLKNNAIDATEEIRPSVLADLDAGGALVSLEILNASRKVDTLPELLATHAPVALEMA
jgi:uncharacterized protein YuzE